jgi:hypothetical protein
MSQAPVESIPAAVDHTPAPPVTAAIESPDDWVEITDTHPEHIRRKCDEVCTKEDDSETWIPVESSIGMPQSAWGFTRIRCRRRDLPPQPRLKRTDTFGRDVTEEYGLHDETDIVTKCIPVRLWVRRDMRSDSGRYYVSLKISPPSDGFTYDEIKIGPV